MITYAFRKWVKLAHWKKALHNPWCHYFWFWRVSLAEYLLVLRALFPLLLQMARCTMVIASTVCIRRWATTRTKGKGHSVHLILCFCGLWLPAGTVTELSVCGLKLLASTMLFCARVVITFYSELQCIQLLLRTFCSMWLWLLNQYDLGCMLIGLKFLVISRNLRLYGLKFSKLSVSVEDFFT
jgi:hypothetical protein